MSEHNFFKEIKTKSYYDETNSLGKIFHFYNWRFFLKNYKKKIELKNIPRCSSRDTSCILTEKLELYWNLQLKKKKPSLNYAIFQIYKWKILLNTLFCLLAQLSLIAQAIFMGFLVMDARNIEKHPESKINLIFSSVMMVFFQFLYVQFINVYNSFSMKTGIKLKVSLSGLIYKKCLKLNKFAFTKTSNGQIINLMTNDVNKLELFIHFLPYPLVSLVVVLIGTYYLYPHLTHYVFYGVLFLLIIMPFQSVMGKLFSKLRAEGSILSDERIRLMNEFVSAIRVIKMYAWENEFVKKINEARKKEIGKIRSAAYKTSFNLGLFFVTSKIVIYVTLVTYVLAGNELNAEKVFIAYSILNRMSFICTLYTPYFVQQTANSLVCFRRIENFLLLDEVEKKNIIFESSTNLKKKNSYLLIKNLFCTYETVEIKKENSFKNAGFVFDEKEQETKNSSENFLNKSKNQSFIEYKKTLGTIDCVNGSCEDNNCSSKNTEEKQKKPNLILKEINLQCITKGLNVIVGPVGSGKSSILLAILGEINVCNGHLDLNGKLSYASQEAWTFGGTVKENILFFSPYEEEKYKKVIKVCCLEIDFTLFPKGDETIVGEKGVSLSGGQKARISLARALYLDADIYLLDDPLSAVDPHVAKHIFKKAIQEYLKEKIVVLVTHQLQFMKNADNVLLLKEGKQIAYGNYHNLLNEIDNKEEFLNFIGLKNNQETSNNNTKNNFYLSKRDSIISSNSIEDINIKKQINLVEKKNNNKDLNNNDAKNFLKSAYWVYIKLGLKGWLGPVMIFTFVVCEFTFAFSDYFLSLWTSSEEKNNGELVGGRNSTSFADSFTTYQSIYFYTLLMAFLFFLSIIRAMLFFKGCMRSSVKLHDRLFKSVVCAPMSFFDNNPIGILLNRCSRDMGIIDDILPSRCFDFTDVFLTDLSIATMIILIYPYLVFPFILLIILVSLFRKLYLESAKAVRLFEGTVKSPVLQHVSSSINGLITIRAFNFQKTFNNSFDVFQNDHTSVYFQFFLGIRFFVYALDTIQLFFMSGILSIIIIYVDYLEGSTIGLIISTCLIFCSQFQWMVKNLSEVEQHMLSVYHVNEYSTLPKEKNLFKKTESLLQSNDKEVELTKWPSLGKIVFENVTMRYKDNENPVLKNLNFSIENRHKIGIVGRTGAGKSSIISALFRMTDYTGSIIIDDVDTKSLTLHDLRKKISIIPQDPILFSGTIRSNLDPFDEYSDHEIWKALKEANLEKTVENMNMGLESIISDSGSNFSVGQKQLICLARAILRRNKILVLDEATANCDPRTDELIQKTIRSVFSDCTILTIAHRLNTIMDSDKILVLDAGELKEYDTPINLIDKTNSLFNLMIKATGKENNMILKKLALSFSKKKKIIFSS